MSQSNQDQQVQMQIPANLEYFYRDFFTVYAGPDDVILEFGNVSRTASNQVQIANRIVISPANAVRLREILDRTIAEMQRRVTAARSTQDSNVSGGNA